MIRPEKIISGGQTGADRGGLLGAVRCGIPTGGTAPRGFRTEQGADETLRTEFGLQESTSRDYAIRTALNVGDSDGTVLFGNPTSAGSMLTLHIARSQRKPYTINPTVVELRRFVMDHSIRVLNVAGNRESGAPGIEQGVSDMITAAFGDELFL